MTKFLVVRGYEHKPQLSIVEFATDSHEDAVAFADIKNRNDGEDSGYRYYVAEMQTEPKS